MLHILYRFFEIPRWQKRLVTLVFDIFFILAAMQLALIIRVGEQWDVWYTSEVKWLVLLLAVSSLAVWIKLGLYRAVIRYLDVKVLVAIFWGATSSVFLLVILTFLLGAELPRSVPFIYAMFILFFIAGSRLLVRGLINSKTGKDRAPVIIYGAGSSGRQLCLALQNGAEYLPVAFVDDDKSLIGTSVAGVDVFDPKRIKVLVDGLKVRKLLFAIPSISSDKKRKIFNSVQELNVEMLTIPGSADLVSGKVSMSQLRSVQIEDLLGRDQVKPSGELLGHCVNEKTVLVTGAGGSIGSELCRQLVKQNPSSLILLEISEFNLYSIEKELRFLAGDIAIYPILGSVTDSMMLDRIFSAYKIDTIYHAAAYKHVPLVEMNTLSGVYNNIWGTKYMAEYAHKYGVQHFVLISTDKAVRPTNIMGTTKRMAELVVQDMASHTTKTTFSMVRFGNVLGSSGSVIPLFRSQIEAGGPVTVTHPEITRYFMTIPEAASLVIQAGALASGGDVFVLDMGKPVKIANLARKMIQLMGYAVKNEENERGDIEIVYSGLRPGEKLYEELLIGGDVLDTRHPRIMRANEISMGTAELHALLNEISDCCEKNDLILLRELLISAPTGFNPNTPVCDLLAKTDNLDSKTQEESHRANVHVIAK
ncbi:MAG: polysaccharide biosynthesis protein [Aestuariibacter sp.]